MARSAPSTTVWAAVIGNLLGAMTNRRRRILGVIGHGVQRLRGKAAGWHSHTV